MNYKERKKILFFGVLGIIASIGVGYGEFLLHFVKNGLGYDSNNFQFFNHIPLSRLTEGHFIAILFTPLYIAGYYHFYLIFKKNNAFYAYAIFVLGIIAFMVGGMWISSRAELGYLVHLISENPKDLALQSLLNIYKIHSEILVKGLRIIILIISVCFSIPILKGKTLYPKFMALLNPLFLLLLIFLTYKIVPKVGNYIGPIAMNVAHFILFFFSIIIVLKSKISTN